MKRIALRWLLVSFGLSSGLVPAAALALVADAATAAADSVSTNTAAPVDSATLAARVDDFTRPYEEAGQLSGVLLVARGDDVLLERAYGYANQEWKIENTMDTRFGIASITKPITLMLLARFVEDGRLALTDPISKWIDDFPRGDSLIVLDLANHTAGVPHRVTEPEDECVARTAADMVELVKKKGLNEDLIGQRAYSTAGFAVLARILELAGGVPYQDLLQQYVFDPAGARQTVHPHAHVLIPKRAEPYFLMPHGVRNAQPKDLSFLVGGGSLYSTAADLHRLVRAVVTGRLGETAQAYVIRNRPEFEWSGLTSGYQAELHYRAEDGQTIVFCGNVISGANFRLQDAVAKILNGETVDDPGPPDITVVPIDPKLLQRLCGHYLREAGHDLDVHTDGTFLYSSEWTLFPLGDLRFFSPQDYGTVDFVLGQDGSVERLDWDWRGQGHAMPMPRIESEGDGSPHGDGD
jgi:CubicO group peptidase (beta-lactamase class C family)